MERLVPIIGKAPSEKLFEEFMEQVRTERTRVREAITSYLATPAKPEPKGRGISTAALNKALSEAGITPEQLKLMLKEQLKNGGE